MSPSSRIRPEWSLVFFTVLAQAAAGVCIVRAVIVRVIAPRNAELDSLTAPLLYGVLGLLSVAGLAAFFHLGKKRGARLALDNLRTSWLSREILTALVLMVVVAARLVTEVAVLDAISALCGAHLVYAISRLYRIRTVPAWDTWGTSATFFGTAALLGSAITGTVPDHVAFGREYRSSVADETLIWLSLATVATAAFLFVVAGMQFRRFPPREGTSNLSRRELRLVHGVRLTCLGVGALLLLFAAGYGLLSRRQILASTAIACLLLLISELIGRFLFYASHRRIGL